MLKHKIDSVIVAEVIIITKFFRNFYSTHHSPFYVIISIVTIYNYYTIFEVIIYYPFYVQQNII